MSMEETGGEAALMDVPEGDNEAGGETTEGTEGEGAAGTSPDDAAAEAFLRKFKVKVDGEELEVDEQTLLKDYELKQASHKRMEEAARLRKQAQEESSQIKALLAQAKEDPSVVLKALGLEPRQWAESLLTKQLELELLSPEERELRELREFKKRQEDERTQIEQERAKKKQQELTLQAEAEIESEVVDALKASGLKPTPRTVARVAEIILASLEAEGPRIKATDALTRLQREYRADVVDHLESLEPATIEKEFPSLYKKILEHESKKQPQMPSFKRGVGTKPSNAKGGVPKPKSWDDWLPD